MANGTQTQRPCLTCGHLFTPKARGARKNYCCRSCWPNDLKDYARSIERAHEQKRKGQRDGLSKSVAACCVCGHDYKLSRGARGRAKMWCSRECASILKRGYGPHLAQVRHHRIADVRPRKACMCGKGLSGRASSWCSEKCRAFWLKGNKSTDIEFKHCLRCGKLFACRAGSIKVCCSDVCIKRKNKSIRRHRLRAAPGHHDEITLFALGERDGWRCHLCGGKVPNRDHKNRVLDPEIDHLVPVSAGGSHTWDNVALAHRRCNMSRGARGPAQLRLLG